jgi:hypothetical protein
MNLIECVKMFDSWPQEVKEVCVMLASKKQTAEAPQPISKWTPKAINRTGKQWTDDERIELYNEFDKHDRNRKIFRQLAKRFCRTLPSIESEYDKNYKAWKASTNIGV